MQGICNTADNIMPIAIQTKYICKLRQKNTASINKKMITSTAVIFLYSEMGNRIKIRRKELRIKQAELAEALEISNNHMSSIENGRQKPSMDIFIGICRHLNVTPDYLLLGTMHAYNVPQDILDKLRLCNQSDIELAKDFIELLVKRNNKNNYIPL